MLKIAFTKIKQDKKMTKKNYNKQPNIFSTFFCESFQNKFTYLYTEELLKTNLLNNKNKYRLSFELYYILKK